MYRKVNFEEAKHLMDTAAELVVLDVREEAEYITGHAPGAVLFTLADINEDTAPSYIPDQSTPVMVYCRSGRRSKMAAEILMELGYKEIYDVGGLIGWPYGME